MKFGVVIVMTSEINFGLFNIFSLKFSSDIKMEVLVSFQLAFPDKSFAHPFTVILQSPCALVRYTSLERCILRTFLIKILFMYLSPYTLYSCLGSVSLLVILKVWILFYMVGSFNVIFITLTS